MSDAAAFRRERSAIPWRIVSHVVLFGAIGLLLAYSYRRFVQVYGPLEWSSFFSDWFSLLWQAIPYTLGIAAVSMVGAFTLGVAVGLARISHDPIMRGAGTVYVELVRGTPLLVQVMIWGSVIGPAYGMSEFWVGVGSLSCFTASYIAEIVRAGIQSIDRGQMEAARSLGLSHAQAMIYIILPQAIRRTLPPLASEFIALVKDSSLVSVVGYNELTKRARDVASSAYMSFEPWITCAGLYLIINLVLSLGVRWLEKRLGVGARQEVIR